jgi:DNA-binding transcriptional regulator GbsR (MarR family)
MNPITRRRPASEEPAELSGESAERAPTSTELEPAAEAGVPLDEHLAAQLPTFEQFFKTFGFKRVHGRIWGLLVLSGAPLSSREISASLGLSQGATSTALNELAEWGAITSEFDSARRCHLHAPVSNTLSIVATVLRRREQVAFQQFKLSASRTLQYVSERYGERDPRVLTLRSIISTCEIAESVMQLVVGAVANALDDSESILYKAVHTALKVGVVMPSRLILRPRSPRGAPRATGTSPAPKGPQEAHRQGAANGHGSNGSARRKARARSKPRELEQLPAAREEQRA